MSETQERALCYQGRAGPVPKIAAPPDLTDTVP